MRSMIYCVLYATLLVSCGGIKSEDPEDTPTSGVIAIASDECFAPFIQQEIAVFESVYKEAGIVPYFSGETETINRLLHDSTRIAIVSRPPTKEETDYMNSKKLFPKTVIIATDAIAISDGYKPLSGSSTENSYKPFQAYIALGNYPMRRRIYLILSEPRNGLASGFTSFVTSDWGQRIILKSGILPATQPVRLVNVRDQL